MVRLKDFNTYRPLPAEFFFKQGSALSATFAFAASDPPQAFTTLLFKIPKAGDVTIARSCGVGLSVVNLTLPDPTALTVIPSMSDEGFPLTFARRFSEKTTSLEVTFVPSENFAFGLMVNVKLVAFELYVHLEAIAGTGFEASPPS